MSHEYVIARFERGGHRFEILVDPDKAFKYREGEKVRIEDVLVGDYIYKDARKGDRASPEEVKKVFGTVDINKVAEVIVKDGELHLTTEQRRKLLENKRKLIVNFIARSAVDPRTKLPIPPQRIERALEEARFAVDLYRSVEEQAAKAIKAIARILPVKIARALISVRVPPQYAGRAYSEIKKLGDVRGEKWLNDGSLRVELEIPAGMQAQVIDSINRVTKGTAEVNVKVV